MKKTKSKRRAMAEEGTFTYAGASSPAASDAVPADRRGLVSAAVFAVGVVLLLPWNMTTTVSGYWDFKFRLVGRILYHKNSKIQLQL